MDVAARLLAHAVDRLGDRDDVVGEAALEAALLPFGSAEVDHPRVGSMILQDRRGARLR